jgi:hypothetical protein
METLFIVFLLLVWAAFGVAMIRGVVIDCRLLKKAHAEIEAQRDEAMADYLERAAERKRWAQPQVDDKLRRAWGEIE